MGRKYSLRLTSVGSARLAVRQRKVVISSPQIIYLRHAKSDSDDDDDDSARHTVCLLAHISLHVARSVHPVSHCSRSKPHRTRGSRGIVRISFRVVPRVRLLLAVTSVRTLSRLRRLVILFFFTIYLRVPKSLDVQQAYLAPRSRASRKQNFCWR